MIKLESNTKNGLTKDSSADCFQVRSVSQVRFVKKLGNVSVALMDEIKVGLSKGLIDRIKKLRSTQSRGQDVVFMAIHGR